METLRSLEISLRYRLRFKRVGPARALSHLQQIDAIRRALTASSWPLVKSRGKRSRAKIAFGPAISVGYESYAEYCDVNLEKRLDVEAAKVSLAPHLSEGFELMSAKSIPRFFPSLDQALNAGTYQIVAPGLEATSAAWEAFEKSERFPVVKKKEDREVIIDARPLLRSWKLEGPQLELTLRFGPGKTLKPERLIQAVCKWPEASVDWRIVRTHLFFEKQSGELVEP